MNMDIHHVESVRIEIFDRYRKLIIKPSDSREIEITLFSDEDEPVKVEIE